jgi:acetyl esterase
MQSTDILKNDKNKKSEILRRNCHWIKRNSHMSYLFWLFICFFLSFIFIFIKLKQMDPELSMTIKLLHFFMTFIFYISGMSPNGKFNRKIADIIAFMPSEYTHKGIQSKDIEIQHYKHENKKVKIRIFEDLNHRETKKPMLIFIHGGGFVMKFNKNYDDYCREISKKGMIVISILYRRAPENPFPASVEDCFSVAKWLPENKTYSLFEHADFNRLCIAGDSAGGNLTAVLCTMIRDQEINLNVTAQILIYPTLFIHPRVPSASRKEKRYLLSDDVVSFFSKSYIGDNVPIEVVESPLANPLKNKNGLKNLPSAFVLTVDIDPIHDEGEIYANELRKSGVEVHYTEYQQTIHGFLVIPWMTHYQRAFDELMSYLQKKLNF